MGLPIVLVQLNPPLPFETSKRSGWAHFVIHYRPEIRARTTDREGDAARSFERQKPLSHAVSIGVGPGPQISIQKGL